ncbi:type II toxin-antitoxin system BrnA family antitoxin [Desulfothermus sp.]
MKKKYITAEEFDKKFDNGEDILEYLDMTQAHRPGLELKRINVEFPLWMIKCLDKEAKRLGVSRESIIKIWIAERLHNTSA